MDGDTAARRTGSLSPVVVVMTMVGLAGVNLAWGWRHSFGPETGGVADVVRMFGVAHLVVAVLAALAAWVGFRRTVGAAAFVRAVAIGTALYFVPLLSWVHLLSDRFGVVARWSETPMRFHPVDVEAASVVLALLGLLAMGRRGAGGEGTAFAPHRFRRSLLVGMTGMASIAVFVGIFAGLGLYRSGLPGLGTLAMAIVFALIARGMLRLRAWTIPAAVAISVLAGIAAVTTRAPTPFLAAAILTPLVLLPLLVALVRAVWARPDAAA